MLNEGKKLRFKKEIVFVVEGDIYIEDLTPEDVLQSLKWSWRHWWEDNPKWPYGTPSSPIRGGKIDKISFNGKELE
jgi:hypothetical protein